MKKRSADHHQMSAERLFCRVYSVRMEHEGKRRGAGVSRSSIPFLDCGGSSTSRRGSKGCRRVVGIRWRGA